VHSHMLDEQPRLFFMHFWANDDARKLARGLRAALDKTEFRKASVEIMGCKLPKHNGASIMNTPSRLFICCTATCFLNCRRVQRPRETAKRRKAAEVDCNH